MARAGEEFQVADKKAIDPLWVWGENADRPRLLHSMLRFPLHKNKKGMHRQ